MGLLTAALGATIAVVGAPAAIAAVGFTAGGIAAGSIAASMMSSAAVAGGGGVVAGGAVAALQSIGAAGFSLAGNVLLGGTGAAIGAVLV